MRLAVDCLAAASATVLLLWGCLWYRTAISCWVPVAMQDRNSAACKGKVAAMIAKQPMFCFETAVKLFFFSSFVYADYNGVRTPAVCCGTIVPSKAASCCPAASEPCAVVDICRQAPQLH